MLGVICEAHSCTVEVLSFPACHLMWNLDRDEFNLMAWSPTEDIVALSDGNSSVRLLDANSGQQLRRIQVQCIFFRFLLWSPCGSYIAEQGSSPNEADGELYEALTIIKRSPGEVTFDHEDLVVLTLTEDFRLCTSLTTAECANTQSLVLGFSDRNRHGDRVGSPVVLILNASTGDQCHRLTLPVSPKHMAWYVVSVRHMVGSLCSQPALLMSAPNAITAPSYDPEIVHLDPPARIDQREAAEFVAQQEAGFVERLIQSHVMSAGASASGQDAHEAKLWKVTFTRCPKALIEALRNAVALQSCLAALEKEGYAWILPNSDIVRVMIFVHPAEYPDVKATIPLFSPCKSFSIFFTKDFEHLIDDVLSNVGKGAVSKFRSERSLTDTCSDAATADTSPPGDLEPSHPFRDFGVQRTFVHLRLADADASSVVQSSTEAHHGGTNPRRVSAFLD